jgi:hypothetical protein
VRETKEKIIKREIKTEVPGIMAPQKAEAC